MKKVVYVSGARSDYSLMKRTLTILTTKVDLTIIATCMHLSPKHGNTIKEIENDGHTIRKVDMLLESGDPGSMAKSFGLGVYGITQVLEEIVPDLVFLEGDRGESLAAAVAAGYLNIPVMHHGGGDTSGSVDNKIRDAITAFSRYHLAGNERSYEKLIRLGIPKDRVWCVGEPGLDDIFLKEYTPREEVFRKYRIRKGEPLILLVQHPNTEEYEETGHQIDATLAAVAGSGIRTIAIFSNADAGGKIINDRLVAISKTNPLFTVFPNIPRADFLGLMNVCDCMVGNSSSGLVELASFLKPFVCIGTRQNNRLLPGHVIAVPYNEKAIGRAIKKAVSDKKYRESLKNLSNPYAKGNTSENIVDIVLKHA
jgi:GDP/UDP-N,N'-diacetylbacillosamine 2-epimerase (hydrolysing)